MSAPTLESEPAPAPDAPPVPAWRRPPVRPILITWAVLTVLLVAFALTVPARLMGTAASPTMREIKSTFVAFTVASAPVAAMVWAIAGYSLVVWRHRGDGPPPDTDTPVRGNQRLQVVWLVVSSALCLFLLVWGLVVLQPPRSEADATTPPLVVDVTGQQWTWSFAYPDHPGLETAEIYVPVDQRVQFRITSKDVIHSFWIVEMGVKVDANPGATTIATVTPDRLGTFAVRCAELCGLYHSYMETKIHVLSKEQYDAWAASAAAAPANG